MPTLNRIRLVNIKYNDDKRTVKDELLSINGESTLALFENAGGKSVLTKYMMQPIMWIYDQYPPRVKEPYFDMKAFFKTNTEPCYVLEEFILEDNEGYLLLGVGIERGEEGKALNKIAFLHHYNGGEDPRSIQNIQLFARKNDTVLLLGLNEVYNSLKPYMDVYRSTSQDHKLAFRRKLLEYHINIKEWEKIHARVISIEGGLAEIFANSKSKSTKELLRNWILEAIEGKVGAIAEDMTQIDMIKANLEKHIEQKIASKADMEQLEQLRLFLTDIDQLYLVIKEKEEMTEEFDLVKDNLVHILNEIVKLKQIINNSITEFQSNIEASKRSIHTFKYERDSFAIKKYYETQEAYDVEYNRLKSEKNALVAEKQSIDRKIKLQNAKKIIDEITEIQSDILEKQELLKPYAQAMKQLEEKTRNIKYTLRQICNDEIAAYQKEIGQSKEKEVNGNTLLSEIRARLAATQSTLDDNLSKQSGLIADAAKFETERERVLCEYPDIPATFQYKDFVEESKLTKFLEQEEAILATLTKEIAALIEEEPLTVMKSETAQSAMHSEELRQQELCRDLERINGEYETFTNEKSRLSNSLRLYRFKSNALDQIRDTRHQLDQLLEEKEGDLREEEKKRDKILERIDFYKNDQLKINPLIEKSLRQNGVDYILGLSYLKNCTLSVEEKIELIRKVPVLPYAILISGNFDKLKKILQKEFTDCVVPVLIKEDLEGYQMERENSFFLAGNGLGLYAGYNEELIDEAYILQQLEKAGQTLSQIDAKLETLKIEKGELNNLRSELMHYPYDEHTEGRLLEQIQATKDSLAEATTIISNQALIYQYTKARIAAIRIELKEKEASKTKLEHKLAQVQEIALKAPAYYSTLSAKERLEAEITSNKQRMENDYRQEKEQSLELANIENSINNLQDKIQSIRIEDAQYLEYEVQANLELTPDGVMMSKKVLKEMLLQCQNRPEFSNVNQLKADIDKLVQKERKQKTEFEHFDLSIELVRLQTYRRETLNTLEKEREKLEGVLTDTLKAFNRVERDIELLEEKIAIAKASCLKLYHKEYDAYAVDKDFGACILEAEENIQNLMDSLNKYNNKASDIDRILPDLEVFSDMSITGKGTLVTVDLDNSMEVYRQYDKRYKELDRKLSELYRQIDKLFNLCHNNYVLKRENKMIGNCLTKMQACQKSEILLQMKERILMQIELYSNQESLLNKEFEQIYGTSLDYTKKVHEELLTFDKNSRIDGKKLFELADIVKEGSGENYEVFLQDVVDSVVSGSKEITYLDNVVNTYNLLDNYISLDNIKAYALKFNAFDEQIKVRFEATHNGGECSGAQRTIIAFAIIKCIMYYTNEGLIQNNRNSTSFMFLDNPFGVMSTKQFLDIFFKIAERFHTTLYSWTDLSKPSVIKMHKNVYSFRLTKVGKKEYISIKDDVVKDNYEMINTDYLREEQQLVFQLE